MNRKKTKKEKTRIATCRAYFFIVISLLILCITISVISSASINYLGYYNGARLVEITGENGASVYGSTEGNCDECDTGTWDWIHSICDRDDGVNTRDNITHAYAPTRSAGTTWRCYDSNDKGVMIIDLGQSRTYNELRVFQMVDSDGWVSHVQMFENQSNPEVWTSIFSETEVSDGSGYSINDGCSEQGYVVADPTVISFSNTTSRYVQLKFRNDGSSPHDLYIEVFSVKLFYNDGGPSPPVPEQSTLLLLSLGFIGIVAIMLTQKKKKEGKK